MTMNEVYQQEEAYQQEEEYGFCAACDAEVSIDPRTYLFGDDSALCFGCATGRQGVFDEPLSCWAVAPKLDELLQAPLDGA